jgi:hypothetical protein
MSRIAWRALFASLRNNWYFLYNILLVTELTVSVTAMALTRPHIVVPCAMIWIVFAVCWPIMLSLVPPAREFMLLPLRARDVGAVLLMLRVGVPTVAVLAVAALHVAIRTVSGDPFFAAIPPRVALQLCAAFPPMVLVPFLPLPSLFWRDRDPLYQRGDSKIRRQAAAAILFAAPAVAIVPPLTRASNSTFGMCLSALLGIALLLVAWRQRAHVVLASFAGGGRAAAGASEPGWHGWFGFLPLLLPRIAWAAAFGLAIPLVLPSARHAAHDGNLATQTLAFFGSCMAIMVFLPLHSCVRAMRLLPVRTRTLSQVLMLAYLAPPTAALFVCIAMTMIFRPDLPVHIAHIFALWLFCVGAYAAGVPPAVRFGRTRAVGAFLFLPSAAAWYATFGIRLTGSHLPPDAWLAATALILLAASYAWLQAGMNARLAGQSQ